MTPFLYNNNNNSPGRAFQTAGAGNNISNSQLMIFVVKQSKIGKHALSQTKEQKLSGFLTKTRQDMRKRYFHNLS